jgi:hypothetical protein
MPKPLLGEWYRRIPAQARSMQSWQGGTSQRCAELYRTSLLRSGGALPTRVSQATRRPISGQSLRQKNRMRVGWNSSQGLFLISSGRSRRRNGLRPDKGWRPDHQKQLQDAEPTAAGQDGVWEFQEARLEVLPAEDRALPHRAIAELDEEAAHRPVLVVPVPDANVGVLL